MHNIIPPPAHALHNVLLSLAAATAALASLAFTVCVVLPLSLIRPYLLPTPRPEPPKVVLIIGASSGIGLQVLKQYASKSITIVAASSDLAKLSSAIHSLGLTKATIHAKVVNLKDPSPAIREAIRNFDDAYGPITHFYAVSGISNHLDTDTPWDLQVTEAMISVNISGTVTAVLSMYELMKKRLFGKICIVGSLAGYYSPANMISYAATKAFINTFATNLRCLAAPWGVDVTTVAPGLIKSRMTDKMRSQQSTIPSFEYESAQGMASAMLDAVENGGIGLVLWPWRQSLVFYALQALNPICDTLGRFIAFKANLSGKKIT